MSRTATTGPNLRANVARALVQVVIKNRTIDWILQERPEWVAEPLARELLYGTVRHYFTLRAGLDRQLEKPLRRKDSDIDCLLLVGAYQLAYTHVADHAVLNETVAACKPLRKPWARGLVNAVLRNWQKPDQTFDHPDWMISRLRTEYAGDWQALLAANNDRAPMSLRVNTTRVDPADYLAALTLHTSARPGPVPSSIILDKPCASATLPGWQAGEIAVQDAGAQCAATLLLNSLEATTDLRVLDACAAPGGKLAHLAEEIAAHGGGHLVGLDHSPARIDVTRGILARLGHELGHELELITANAADASWWDGHPFTHILVDAPCSGTGTLRRHPDIKLLLNPAAIDDHVALQLAILENLWPMLAPGGSLLYCTCSLFEAENDGVVTTFLEALGKKGLQYGRAIEATGNNPSDDLDEHKEANVVPITLPTGRRTRHGWQLLPTDPRTDGFYYALLKKSADVPDTTS